jgi:hypothetical protein
MGWGSRSAAALMTIAMVVGLGLTAGTPPSAQASIKAGKPCPAVGKQVVKGQWTFTCKVRKGKKVWVRSVRPVWERVAEDLFARAQARGVAVPEGSFDISASPSVPSSVARAVADSIEWSYEPWQEVAPLPSGYPVAIIDEDSREWYLEFSSRYPGDNCGPGWWERTQRNPQYSHGAVCSGSEGDWNYLAYYLAQGTSDISDFLAMHESVHVAQGILSGDMVFNRFAECWLGEGMAELYAGALSTFGRSAKPSLTSTRSYRHMIVGNLRLLNASADEVGDSAYWLDLIRRSEDRGSDLCINLGLGYSLGYLVTEKLVADFGEESLFTWLAASRDEQDPDGAFADVFGIEQDRWYAESAAPYVAKEASRILAR